MGIVAEGNRRSTWPSTAGSSAQRHPAVHVVGQNPISRPELGALVALQPRPGEAEPPLEVADAAFCSSSVSVASTPARGLLGRGPASLARDDAVADVEVVETRVGGLVAIRTVGVDRAHLHPRCLSAGDGSLERAGVVGVAGIHLM